MILYVNLLRMRFHKEKNQYVFYIIDFHSCIKKKKKQTKFYRFSYNNEQQKIKKSIKRFIKA